MSMLDSRVTAPIGFAYAHARFEIGDKGSIVPYRQPFPLLNPRTVHFEELHSIHPIFMDDRQLPIMALLDWFRGYAPWGIFVTDRDFRITLTNKWLNERLPQSGDAIINRPLTDLIPGLTSRGLDRYYQQALEGQSRVLSHKFHRYLIPMKPAVGGAAFTLMQQSARIFPLTSDGATIGTVTVVEDVTERVLREEELYAQVFARDALLLKDRLAIELHEENSSLNGQAASSKEGPEEMMEAARIRDQFLHQIIVSQEEERKRVARNIHDHLGQELTALRFALSALESDLKEGRDTSKQLEKCKALASGMDSEVGFLSSELRPTGLDELGLVQSLLQFVEGWSDHFAIDAELHSSGVDDLEIPSGIAINIYRIAQEALNNISKHSGATLLNVLVEYHDGTITLIIEDNGKGFEPPDQDGADNSRFHGMGLIGMRERAALIQGSMEIESVLGRGTTIYLRVPLGRP